MNSSSWPITSDFHAARSTNCNFLKLLFGEIQSFPLDVFVVRGPADGRLLALGAAVDAVHDPFEHPHVVAEAGPDEFAVCIFAEPVHVEDAGRAAERALHLDPVAEIIAHVIAAERQHGHGIAADLADFSRRGGGHLRSHGGADIYPGTPVESLVDERNGAGAAAAENDRADGNAGGILPGGINRRTLRSRSGKARVGMRRLGAGFLCAISGVH